MDVILVPLEWKKLRLAGLLDAGEMWKVRLKVPFEMG